MKMLKGIKIFIAVFCLAFVGTSTYFLANPQTVLAAVCTAKCDPRADVTCSGNICNATDGWGCEEDHKFKLCDGRIVMKNNNGGGIDPEQPINP